MIDKYNNIIVLSGFTSEYTLSKLNGGGSDREFFRIAQNNKSAILMTGIGHGAVPDNWLEIQKFLSNYGFGVPEVLASDLKIPAIVVEDLGELNQPASGDYPAVIRELARLAFVGGANIKNCPTVANRPFDFDAFKQESGYFSERFLSGYKKIAPSKITDLNDEFEMLAKKLSSLPKGFCHRDFQSTNVFMVDNRVRIIDFQSAKFGPPHYDLASLLWDPYAETGDDFREEMVKIYLDESSRFGLNFDKKDFDENLRLCAISRLMQALGAYCFLSSEKGKTDFLKFMPVAVNRLKTLLRETRRFAGLNEMLVDF